MDDSSLRAVVRASLAHEQVLLGTHSAGAQVFERPGVVGAIMPVIPQSSMANSVVVLDPQVMTPALIAELDAAYDAAGIAKWGVWFDPEQRDVQGTVSAAGLVFDSHPTQMGAVLDDL